MAEEKKRTVTCLKVTFVLVCIILFVSLCVFDFTDSKRDFRLGIGIIYIWQWVKAIGPRWDCT